ncbi:hypothetical protein BGX33_005988 [Mortierella sp. NVP41]|nr:hypothetical protein BGX33_005988 [Mortierella sp. NVP41]
MNTAFIQPDPEQQGSNKGTNSNSNNNPSTTSNISYVNNNHSNSRDYLYPVGGSHGSLSTSYDAFFTDEGYNEADQGGIMAVPYTNGPVEFEDSRFYEGRYEDGVHEYDYDASSNTPSHSQQQQQQQQQQQHLQQRMRFSEEPVATEPTILAGNYRRHRQPTAHSIKQADEQQELFSIVADIALEIP